jgi:hypothetical protein
MKTHLSFPRAALMALALGTVSATAALADTATTTTPSTSTTNAPTGSMAGGWHHHHHWDHVLTATERAELKKDKQQALAANGTLQAQAATLKQQFEALKSQGSAATPAQWQALHAQRKAFETQLRSAIENVDPNAAALYAKIEAAHAQHQRSS